MKYTFWPQVNTTELEEHVSKKIAWTSFGVGLLCMGALTTMTCCCLVIKLYGACTKKEDEENKATSQSIWFRQ
jgi:hypothetical protein